MVDVALATLPAPADEAGEPPPKLYELRDNLRILVTSIWHLRLHHRLAMLLVGGTMAGCGGGGTSAVLSADGASRMRAHLAAVHAAAAGRDPRAATQALDAFAEDVTRQRSAGRLSASQVAALRTAISRARDRIAVEIHAPVAPLAPTAVTPPAAPTPVAPPPAAGNGKGHGNAKPEKAGSTKQPKGHGKG